MIKIILIAAITLIACCESLPTSERPLLTPSEDELEPSKRFFFWPWRPPFFNKFPFLNLFGTTTTTTTTATTPPPTTATEPATTRDTEEDAAPPAPDVDDGGPPEDEPDGGEEPGAPEEPPADED